MHAWVEDPSPFTFERGGIAFCFWKIKDFFYADGVTYAGEKSDPGHIRVFDAQQRA